MSDIEDNDGDEYDELSELRQRHKPESQPSVDVRICETRSLIFSRFTVFFPGGLRSGRPSAHHWRIRQIPEALGFRNLPARLHTVRFLCV